MKFLALLKDSFREAVDTKVFYVMVGTVVLCDPAGRQRLLSARDRARRKSHDNGFLHRWDKALAQPSPRSRRTVRAPDHRLRARRGPTTSRATRRSAVAVHLPCSTYCRPSENARQAPPSSWPPAGLPEGANGRRSSTGPEPLASTTWTPTLIPPDKPDQAHLEATTSIARRHEEHHATGSMRRRSCFGLAAPAFCHARSTWAGLLVDGLHRSTASARWVGHCSSAVVLTAFFMPNMLRKGTVDLLLVKPIHRFALLLYKYVGGLTFIFLNTAFAMGGVWLVIGLRSGIWAQGFSCMILVFTFYFAILYAVSALFGGADAQPHRVASSSRCAGLCGLCRGLRHRLFDPARGPQARPASVMP